METTYTMERTQPRPSADDILQKATAYDEAGDHRIAAILRSVAREMNTGAQAPRRGDARTPHGPRA